MKAQLTWLMKSLFTWLRNADLVLVFGPLLILACLWLFLYLADAVEEGEAHEIDKRIFLALVIVEPSEESDEKPRLLVPSWFAELTRDVTALGGVFVLVLVTALVAGFLAILRCYHAVVFILASTLGGLAVSSTLKEFFDRERPDLVPHQAKVHTPSFPSGHSMLSAVVYLTIASFLVRLVDRKRLKFYILGCALLVTALVGISRVMLGVHWPTDVLAGWSAGLCWAALCSLLARWLQQRHVLEVCLSSDEKT